MTIGELSKRLQEYLEGEGVRIDADAPDAPSFAGVDPTTGLSFVFSLPGEAGDDLGDTGVELQVILPLLDWAQLNADEASMAAVKDLLACQDTLPGSVNSLGYTRGTNGQPQRITLQGSTGLQSMSGEDEKDVKLLLESLALDSVDVMQPLHKHLHK